jgi:hypothetical protein
MKNPVSRNNPCPFLRAMTAYGYLRERAEPLLHISRFLSNVGGPSRAEGKISRGSLFFVALIANGLRPLRLLKSFFGGVDIERLRDGPLDKHGAGSGIIGKDGTVNKTELARLDSFAIDAHDPDTKKPERGLTLEAIQKMMDANFARAKGRRRRIDRRLMDGEWPPLLGIMGKGTGTGRYLSLTELGELFLDHTLPQRILSRIERMDRAPKK